MTAFGRSMNRRRALGALAAVAGAGAWPHGAAWANDFPTRPLKFVVNFPPGGPVDLLARLVAARLGTTLKQTVVVENVAGALGTIGAAAVGRAQPDGHTVLFTIDSPLTVTPVLSPEVAFKPEDLRPVTLLGTIASTLVVNPGAGLASLAELTARGRREPITFSTAGVGSPGHFGAVMVAEATGIKINPIHYKGNAPAVTAVLSGEVQAGVLATGGVAQHVSAGKLRALAVAGAQRSTVLPDVPTAAEAGMQGVELLAGFLAMVPQRVPDATVAALREAILEATRQREWADRMRALDAVTTTLGSKETTAWIAATTERYRRIVKATGMKAE